MDELTKAVYRAGCFLAAIQTRGEDEDIRATFETANWYFEQLVPLEEREPEAAELAPVQQHPNADTFLEEVRQRAKATVSAKDKEKMARAAAMADEEKMEHDQSETPIDIRR